MLRRARLSLWFWRGNCLTYAAACGRKSPRPSHPMGRSIRPPGECLGASTDRIAVPQEEIRMSNPLAQQDRSGAPATDPASRDPFSIPSEIKASIRVLVVDDERTLRESCASVLQMDGYNVT